MQREFLVSILALSSFTGCQAGISPPNKPVASVSSGSVNPTPITSGSPPGSQGKPSPSTSQLGMALPSPTPFVNTCGDLPKSTKLGVPLDLVVSPEGKTVYVPAFVQGQGAYLYELKSGQPIRVLDLRATEAACHFLDTTLGKDSQGRIYLLTSRSTVDGQNADAVSVLRLEVSAGKPLLTKVYGFDQGHPTPSPSGHPTLGYPEHMFLDEKDQVYLFFNSRNYVYPSNVYRVETQTTLKPMLVLGVNPTRYRFAFDAQSEILYTGYSSADRFLLPPFPKDVSAAQPIFNAQPYPLKVAVVDMQIFKGKLLVATQPSEDGKIGPEVWRFFPQEQRGEKIAGGKVGYKDGQGEEAEFTKITALDLDKDGNIFVTDVGNQAIRKITPEGVVTTFYRESGAN